MPKQHIHVHDHYLQTFCSLKPLGQSKSNFMMIHLGGKGTKIYKNVVVVFSHEQGGNYANIWYTPLKCFFRTQRARHAVFWTQALQSLYKR